MTTVATKPDPRRPYKALMAGGIAGLAFLVGVADDGVTLVDGLGTALAALVGFNGAFWVSNPRVPADEG